MTAAAAWVLLFSQTLSNTKSHSRLSANMADSTKPETSVSDATKPTQNDGVADQAANAASAVKENVFSMFGGGPKKEKKEEKDDEDEPSGSSKKQAADDVRRANYCPVFEWTIY